MTGVIATIPKFQFSSATGAPLANGTLTTYLAGTTTLAVTYQDQALVTANTNPIILDSRGECVLWFDSAKTYKLVLKNSAGVIQWTQDNLTNTEALVTALTAALAAPSGSSLVGSPALGSGIPATTLAGKLKAVINLEADFGCVMDGDSTTGLNLLMAYIASIASPIVLPGGAGFIGAGALVVDLSGRWGVTSQIEVPPMTNVKFLGGCLFAMPSFAGDFILSFNTATASRLSYESCSLDGVLIDAMHKGGCLQLNEYNRFYIGGGTKFAGYSTNGLYLGNKTTGTGNGHELFTDGMSFVEYDYFSGSIGNETGLALFVGTNDNHIKNFVISSAKQAIVIGAPGNRLGWFHVWGCVDRDRCIHVKSGVHTGTTITDFKLGGVRMLIEDPSGIIIDDWNAEFVAGSFGAGAVSIIELKATSTGTYVLGTNIQNGTVQVVGAYTGAVYSVRAEETGGNSVSYITVTAGGSGYTTAAATITGAGTGATVTPHLANGKVIALRVVTPGSGYTSVGVSITGDGVGAAATATIQANAGTWNPGVIFGTTVKNNAIVGAVNPVQLETSTTLFAGFATASSRAISYQDSLLFYGYPKITGYSSSPTAGSSNKAAAVYTSVDTTAKTATIAFFTDYTAATPASVQGDVSISLCCTADMRG